MPSFLRILTLITAALALLPTGLRAFTLPESSSQCIVGIADGWNSSHVTLSLHEKSGHTWRQVGRRGADASAKAAWSGAAASTRTRPASR